MASVSLSAGPGPFAFQALVYRHSTAAAHHPRMPRKPKPDISEGDEVILRGRVTKVMDGDRPIFVVQMHHAMVEVKLQMSREGIERASKAT